MKTLQLFIVNMLIGLFYVSLMAQTSYYVKPASSGLANGSSWINATTLSGALSTSVSGDVIHIAAGTYVPTVKITNGTDDLDMTFEIKNNIKLIGGYPANPSVNDNPSASNKSILSGEIVAGYKAYHVVAITAPVEDGKKVILEGLTIKNGQAFGTATYVTINTIKYYRNQGGALTVAKSIVELNACNVSDNSSLGHTPGIYMFSDANVSINNSLLQNNIGSGNAGAIWNEASTLYVNNSSILANKIVGVGAGMQLITSSKNYIYNTTIANNIVGMNGETSRSGAGVYVRNGSVATFVNCTIYGNEGSGLGGGLCTHGTGGTTINLINTTISKNKASNGGGGVYNNADCSINAYNSIVAHNLGKLNADFEIGGVAILKKHSIVGDTVYDNSGSKIVGKSFDFSTQLDTLANNGGTTHTCKLLMAAEVNPAKTLGMTTSALGALGATFIPAIPTNVITHDQLGNLRAENFMGAWTADKTISGLVTQSYQKPIVYVDNNNLFVKSETNDKIALYNITGQLIRKINATSNLTNIGRLIKGNIYIVNLNGQSTKIVL